MKVLVYFNPGPKNDCFQGTRLRKNIKAALELNKVSWVESPLALPDVAHFLSPDDENKANDLKEDGVKIVVSALYAEEDPFSRFLSVNSDGDYFLRPKAERMIQMADLVLVPSLSGKNALLRCGINNPNVKVLSPGVNLARFENSDPVEYAVFSKYMRRDINDKFVICIGDYEDNEAVQSFAEIASLVPERNFDFFGSGRRGRLGMGALKKLNKNAPPNAHYHDLVEDDVYRSGVMSSSVYLALARKPTSLGSLEAMAAKTQIIVYGKPLKGEILVDKKNCYAYASVERTAKAIQSYCENKLPPTIIEAYKEAKAASLSLVGKKLKAYYESVLMDSEE
ncbi:MAG: glycosyltransferase [Bacilli bacterium]|jgi:glycosyltransferase involved in cell wall biosynthesis|nr:glycosyltransferase [Bacilli bacterium]MCH4210383.1 glycosyltransferase [Bacilli bacterium]MCH4277567.1 glycosyltransferase [Bacilli bacterium]MCI2055119.1 glycosyltransferase [Bacilli bacterium]